MRLAAAAWQEVDVTTIQRCWNKSGIIPDCFFQTTTESSSSQAIPLSTILNNTEPALDAEKEVQRGLDDLEEIGALQATNRMRIEDLLNPSDEKDIIQECSDCDIFQAVMDVRAARENAEITGGADDADDDAAVIIRPSRSEALKAVSTIQQFLSPVDEPFARKLEGLLASFGRQTRLEGMKMATDSEITSYFSSK
ncbi:hypothetical protein C8J56DRAFT_1061156 [Mycena floridula]|nr:hypothetical protein C8J56DRAFT_1061156 [Mycena floridula]